jgi:predicted membrane chloride channel (bestrophin family)
MGDDHSYGEESRQYRRTYYSHDDWVRHRSNGRFLRNLVKTFQSGIARQLFTEIGLVALIALVTCTWNALLVTGYKDLEGVLHEPVVRYPLSLQAVLPLQPFTLSSPALGLLLVFRTNASYGRWSEARKAWGAITNHSRNIARMGSGWVTEGFEPDDEKRREVLKRLTDAIWVFPRSLQRHLLGEIDDEAYIRDLQGLKNQEMIEGLVEARHKPTRALYELTSAVNALPMSYLRRIEVDKSIVALCDAMGACERIFTSPVPLVYTRHTARFLGFWILALPLGLWSSFDYSWNHVALVPAAMAISFFLFGIEELAIQLEEPFSILPLTQMVNGIKLCAEEAMHWHFEEGFIEYRLEVAPDLSVLPSESEVPKFRP